MQAFAQNYELCGDSIAEEPPYCPHGPTLLFAKSYDNGTISKFYACAISRSRKDCNFYQPYSKKDTPEKTILRRQIYEKELEINKHFIFHGEKLGENPKFCVDCGVFIPSDLCTDKMHKYQYKELTTDDIRYPSRWIKPLESSKTNAQYFFSADVINFVSKVIVEHKVDKVLCIGAPSVHEHLKNISPPLQVPSFLLDIDVRMRQFHTEFAHYNMFNHHFYNALEPENFVEFIENCRHLMIIIDPPYGGLLNALSHTFDKISAATNGKVTRLLFLPYFMEPQVTKQLPGLSMSDYKVDYANHSGFKGGSGGRARGSPARIFTDIPLREFVLPAEHDYRYCEKCERYISKENIHCDKCASCTTKDGPTYYHCDICGRCFKPSRTHCTDCNQCEFNDHACANHRTPADDTPTTRQTTRTLQKKTDAQQLKRSGTTKRQSRTKRRK